MTQHDAFWIDQDYDREHSESGLSRFGTQIERTNENDVEIVQTAYLVVHDGNAYSIADIAVVPFIKRIDEEIAPDEMTSRRHPRVAEWWAKVQARPAFAKARIEGFQDELAKT